jgi:Na+-driven multidrug efflux pump
MQQGWPGLAVALLRYVVLTMPCLIAGFWLAISWGYPGVLGALVGLVLASAVASLVFLVWMQRAIAAHEAATAS